MGKFKVKVTKRSDEWSEENAPLDTPEHNDPSRPPTGPAALGCTIGNCNVDTPGYGGGEGPVSPLSD